ncbi:MAG: radical SAM protein [Desulfurococcales archaeon]|nr:radical SAM protein [Desulfurococcales archaeon]
MKEYSRKIHYTFKTGYYIGCLPVGCRLCLAGTKIVVFVTGLCSDNCWYCPVSRQKLGRDLVYVNEVRVRNYDDIINEAYRIGAMGAGLTGGDPITRIDRTCNIIRLLKREFGNKFHIHLYTSGRLVDRGVISRLEESGLDEIRFHTYNFNLLKPVEGALETNMDVGVEVPFIPQTNYINYLKRLIQILDAMGVKFININEFEVSESNIERVLLHGLKPRGLTIESIEDKALEFLKWAASATKSIHIHYCTVKFKDMVQYRMRNYRKAINTMGVHEIPTSMGTLISIKHISGTVPMKCLAQVKGERYLIPGCDPQSLRNVKAAITEYYPGRIDRPLNQRIIVY